MKSILIASLFCMDNFLPILIGLLGAGLLGWLLKGFLGGGSGSNSAEWQTKYDGISAELQKEKEKNAKLQADKKSKGSSNSYNTAAPKVDGISAGEAANLNAKIKQLKEEIKIVENAKVEADSKANAALTKAKEATSIASELESTKTRIEGLQKALETSKKEAERSKADFDNANSERTRLSQQLANSDLGAMQKKLAKLESDLDSARALNGNLQSEVDRLKAIPKPAPVVKEVITAPRPVVSNINSESDKEIMTLKSENQHLKMQHENNKLVIQAAVNEAMAKNNSEIVDMRTRLKYAEQTIAKLESDKARLAMAVGTTSLKAPELKEIPKPTPAPAPEPIVEEVVEKSAEPIEVVESFSAATAAVPDDLKIIEGIGPVLEKVLNEGGVSTFAQLASMDPSAVKAILEASGDMLHNPTSWPQQAALLRDGKMEEFKALTDSLKGGIA
jgi:predicted flap endonuclease-1-like 5' DNA nuclease